MSIAACGAAAIIIGLGIGMCGNSKTSGNLAFVLIACGSAITAIGIAIAIFS